MRDPVTIFNPETGGTATVPRAAFVQTWSRKGFVLADDAPEIEAAEPLVPEHDDEHDNPDDQEG